MKTNIIHRLLKSLVGPTIDRAVPIDPAVSTRPDEFAPSPTQDRRGDIRFTVRTRCRIDLLDAVTSTPADEAGEAFSLNVSSDGILLLMDRRPTEHQLLAMRHPSVQQPVPTVFEVRWLQHLPIGSQPQRYLVGCRLTSGRFPYFLVQRHRLDRHISGLSL